MAPSLSLIHIYEHPEHTGFAHLFEHLMFGGSVHIPDYDAPLQLAGGENNAWTNNDIDVYKRQVQHQFRLPSEQGFSFAQRQVSADPLFGQLRREAFQDPL